MKKIIATVLAMVMALALCTTAFAATAVKYTKQYDADNGEVAGTWNITKVAAKYKGDAKANNVEYYEVVNADNAIFYLELGSEAEYDYKYTADGKADLYLKGTETNVAAYSYYAKAVEYTNIGDDCGQLKGDEDDTYYKVTYVDSNKEQVTEYFVEDEAGAVNLLVDGELVAATALSTQLNGHSWKASAYDDKDNVTAFTCEDCGVVATVYKTHDAAKAAGKYYGKIGNLWAAWNSLDGSTTTTTDTTTTTSPKTFDAGIAMYVGMALTSVAGSAVVIGKKKEF